MRSSGTDQFIDCEAEEHITDYSADTEVQSVGASVSTEEDVLCVGHIVDNSGTGGKQKIRSISAKKRSFRLSGKRFFITYPQNDMEKGEALQRLKKYFGDKYAGAVVAREHHKDGANHLHIVVLLSRKHDITRADGLDVIGGKHGNYQTVRNLRDCVIYVTKDNDYIEDGDMNVKKCIDRKGLGIRVNNGPRKTVGSEVAEMIVSGKSYKDVVDVYPSYAMQNKRKIEEFEAYIKRNKVEVESFHHIEYRGKDMNTTRIVEWMTSNLGKTREFKQGQIWISGPPDSLKTSLANYIGKFQRIYWLPLDEGFYDDYEDDAYDLIVIDEFRGQKTIQWLNLLLQGGVMCIRKKGSQYMKKKNVPVMILSNYTPEEAYRKAAETGRVDTLKARLDPIVVLYEAIDLDNILFCVSETVVVE